MAGWEDLPEIVPASSWEDLPELDAVPPGSPLAQALASQTGDVVTVDTPTGPAQFDRKGNRVYSQDEVAQQLDAGGARLKQRALEGALSFLSGGGPLVDEAQGVKSALSRGVATIAGNDAVDPLTAYRQGRDSTRALVKSSTASASPVVGGLPVLPLLGAVAATGPVGATAPARILASAVGAGLQGAGNTEADLTKGDVRGFLSDTGVATGTGAAAGLGGELLGLPLRALSKATGREAAAAAAAQRELDQAAAQKAVNAARGALGGETSSAMRTLEQARFAVDNPTLVSPQTLKNAQDFLASPEAEALLNRALQNTVARGGSQVGRIDKARAAMVDAIDSASPAAVDAVTAAKLAPDAVAKNAAQRLWRSLGQRAMMGAAGAGLGAGYQLATGGDVTEGVKWGGGTGFVIPPGALQTFRNLGNSPAVQHVANQAVADLLRASANGAARAGAATGAAAAKARTDVTNEERRALLEYLRGAQPFVPIP